MDLFSEMVDVIFDGVQSKAAAALGVDKSLVSRLCTGSRTRVSADLAQKIELVSQGRYRKELFVWPDGQKEISVQAPDSRSPEKGEAA